MCICDWLSLRPTSDDNKMNLLNLTHPVKIKEGFGLVSVHLNSTQDPSHLNLKVQSIRPIGPAPQNQDEKMENNNNNNEHGV